MLVVLALEKVAKGGIFVPPYPWGWWELQLPSVPAMEKVTKGWMLVAPAPRWWPRAGSCPRVPVAPARVDVTQPGPLFPLMQFPRG